MSTSRRSVQLDPLDARARYFLATDKDFKGNHSGALNDWLVLLEDTPPGAPWEADLLRTIDEAGRANKIATKDRVKKALAGRSPITSGPQ